MLDEGLPPGQGGPAAGFLVEGPVLHDDVEDLLDRPLPGVGHEDPGPVGVVDLESLELAGPRVGAPGAAHGAALEEDDGADTRPVVDGELLDVEDLPPVSRHRDSSASTCIFRS